MSISIIDKKRKKDKNGKEVRKVIKVVNDITVYAPTMKQLEYIKKFVENHIDEKKKKLTISGEDVFRVLYKELTNLKDVDKVSDEELRDIVENPEEDLEEVNNVLSDELTKICNRILREKIEVTNTLSVMINSIILQNKAGKLVDNGKLKLPKEIKDGLGKIKKLSKEPLKAKDK